MPNTILSILLNSFSLFVYFSNTIYAKFTIAIIINTNDVNKFESLTISSTKLRMLIKNGIFIIPMYKYENFQALLNSKIPIVMSIPEIIILPKIQTTGKS